MKVIRIALLLAPILLTGCSAVLAKELVRDAEKQCETKGMHFVQDKVETNELVVVSSATVSGHCEPNAPAPPKQT